MKILGIDTSTMAANVSVLEDDKLICEYTINTKKTHSQKLMSISLSFNIFSIIGISFCE